MPRFTTRVPKTECSLIPANRSSHGLREKALRPVRSTCQFLDAPAPVTRGHRDGHGVAMSSQTPRTSLLPAPSTPSPPPLIEGLAHPGAQEGEASRARDATRFSTPAAPLPQRALIGHSKRRLLNKFACFMCQKKKTKVTQSPKPCEKSVAHC